MKFTDWLLAQTGHDEIGYLAIDMKGALTCGPGRLGNYLYTPATMDRAIELWTRAEANAHRVPPPGLSGDTPRLKGAILALDSHTIADFAGFLAAEAEELERLPDPRVLAAVKVLRDAQAELADLANRIEALRVSSWRG